MGLALEPIFRSDQMTPPTPTPLLHVKMILYNFIAPLPISFLY